MLSKYKKQFKSIKMVDPLEHMKYVLLSTTIPLNTAHALSRDWTE